MCRNLIVRLIGFMRCVSIKIRTPKIYETSAQIGGMSRPSNAATAGPKPGRCRRETVLTI